MNTRLTFAIVLVSAFITASSLNGATWEAVSTNNSPMQCQHQIGERGAHHREWLRVMGGTNEVGQLELSTNVAYVELGTGLNYRDAKGQWQETEEEFKVVPGWAVAHKGPHKVSLAYNLNTAGSVAVQMPDGRMMRSQVLSLHYLDSSTGQSVRLAEIKDCAGKVLPPNRVIYEDAFTGLKADVRFTYTKAGIEQDVILRERPPKPETLGLNPETTRLAVLTEFVEPPQATVRTVETTERTRAGGVLDEDVDFGSMRIGRGKAFTQDTNSISRRVRKQAPVIKKWMQLNGRHFLLEQVSFPAVQVELDKLPEQAGLVPKPPRTMLAGLELPEPRLAVGSDRKLEIAHVFNDSPGYVLDYLQLNAGLTNFTFRGDMTYYVSGTVNLYGTNTIEGGTVIKFNSGAATYLTLEGGAVNCLTGPYRPALFTSKDDNAVGEAISGSTGSPTYILNDVYYLILSGMSDVKLHNIRMAYGYDSLTTVNCSNVVVSDLQILHSYYPVYPVATTGLKIRNALFFDTPDVAFWIDSSDVSVEQATFNQCWNLGFKASMSGASLAVTNSLLVSVTNFGDVPLTTNSLAITSGSTNFQTVGEGGHYLAASSPYRNAGTTNIDATLLAELKWKTTYPPVVYSNATIYSATTLSPQATRDTDTPDLGYHYEPLDYVFGGSDLYADLTIDADTAVGWFKGFGGVYSYGQPYGLSINNGGNVFFTGTATQPANFLWFNLVQEGNGNWPLRGWMSGLMLNGSGSAPLPQIRATFTKWFGSMYSAGFFRDRWNHGEVNISNSEFWGGGFATYAPNLYFTNCLFNRQIIFIAGDVDSSEVTFLNCTFNNGGMAMKRYSWKSPSLWLIKNTVFDGTALETYDQFNANTNYTAMDYNAYNLANTNWQSYWQIMSEAPNTNVLEMAGTNDVMVTNYNWQAGPLGKFYLPNNSALVDAGSTNADLLGLYHYTTDTEQTKEYNSPVDIGYHYVASDEYGNPVHSDPDGVPDYWEDANGNELVDNGETDWQSATDMGLRVRITRPGASRNLP